MSVGFQLRARAKSGGGDAAGCFERLVAAVEGRWPEAVCWQTDEGGVVVRLNPAVAPIEIRWEAEGEVELEATTSSGGPGFHQAAIEVCELIAAACELELLLEDERTFDETGYLVSRSRRDVEESMLGWLRNVMRLVTMKWPGLKHAANIGMAVGLSSDVDGYIHTRMGPRDEQWALRVVAEPSAGEDYFIWWDEGQTPKVLRSMAIAIMWTDVYWDGVLAWGNGDAQWRVLSLLRRAYEIDPELVYPWREWAEILGYQRKRESESLHRRIEIESARASGPLIGYRRGNIEHRVGECRLSLPGNFRDWSGDEGLFATDGYGREVDITLSDDGGEGLGLSWLRLDLPDVFETIEVLLEGEICAGVFWCPKWPEGGELPAVVGKLRKGKSVLTLVVRCRNEGDREWADGVWRRLK